MLKVTASWPISSGGPGSTGRDRSPEAIDSAPRSMRFRRRAMKYEAR